jgi:hypothetical protein
MAEGCAAVRGGLIDLSLGKGGVRMWWFLLGVAAPLIPTVSAIIAHDMESAKLRKKWGITSPRPGK